MSQTQQQPIKRQQAVLVKWSMFMGVVLFGIVIVVLHRQAGFTPTVLPVALPYAQPALVVASVIAALVVRGRMAREASPANRWGLMLIGCAISEGAALFGAVIYFLSDNPQWYLLGLGAQLAVFAMLRIPRDL